MSKIINKEDVLRLFFEEPSTLFYVREVARLLSINATTASKYLKVLSEEDFLVCKEELGHLLFRARTDSYKYKDAKIFYNMSKIRKSGLIEYLEKELHYPETVILFGSCAKGENDKNSDIDIFIISREKKDPNMHRFEKILNAKIQLFIKTKDDFKKLQKENKNLANSFINGIVIKGYLEAFL